MRALLRALPVLALMVALILAMLPWDALAQTATPTATATATATPTITPVPAVGTPVPVGRSTDTLRGNATVRGILTALAGLRIGSEGEPIAASYRGNYTVDVASVTNATCLDTILALSGATVGSQCALGLPAAPTANLSFLCFVPAVDKVTLRVCNPSAAPVNPASAAYTIRTFAP